MASLNSFDFTGHLGRDPELRSLPSGQDVCNLSVAVDTYGDKPTLWVDVSVWGAGAAACAKYLHKRSHVAIHGSVDDVNAYEKRDGTLGASLRVSTRDVSFLDGKGDSNGSAPRSEPVEDFQPVGAGGPLPDADDEIPFAACVI
jgi:single-strand DNA-binding protein